MIYRVFTVGWVSFWSVLFCAVTGCTPSDMNSRATEEPKIRTLAYDSGAGESWAAFWSTMQNRSTEDISLDKVWMFVGKKTEVKLMTPDERRVLKTFWQSFLACTPKADLKLHRAKVYGEVTHYLSREIDLMKSGMLRPSLIVEMPAGEVLLVFPTTEVAAVVESDLLVMMIRKNDVLWHRFLVIPEHSAFTGDGSMDMDSARLTVEVQRPHRVYEGSIVFRIPDDKTRPITPGIAIPYKEPPWTNE
jgi:hypothetical protein